MEEENSSYYDLSFLISNLAFTNKTKADITAIYEYRQVKDRFNMAFTL